MPEPFQFGVFLSHNSKDKPRVRRLAERLKAAAVNPKAEGKMQNAELLHSTFFILPSPLVVLERSTAVHRDPANAGPRFIPLLLGDCVLPDTLRHYKVVDFRGESEAAFAEVLATCRPETPPFLLGSTRASRGGAEKPVRRKTVTVS